MKTNVVVIFSYHEFVAIGLLLNLCYFVLFLYLCYYHLHHCYCYHHYYFYFFFLRNGVIRSKAVGYRIQKMHYLWESCSSRCYRTRVSTLFVVGCFGHKYLKGDLMTLNILKAIKAPKNSKFTGGEKYLQIPLFLFVIFATSFEKILNMRIWVFWITKHQSLDKISLWILKITAILKMSIEMSISIISFLVVISRVKSEVAMAKWMTVDFIVEEVFLDDKIWNAKKILLKSILSQDISKDRTAWWNHDEYNVN